MIKRLETVLIFLTIVLTLGWSYDIYYNVPQEVSDITVLHIFPDRHEDVDSIKYLCLLDNRFDTTSLLFIEIDNQSPELMDLYENSNRKIIIGTYIVPLLFYADIRFSSIFNTENLNGSISANYYLFGGFRITFVGKYTSGKVLRYGWDR